MFEAAAEQGLALSFLGGPGDLPELARMMAKHPSAPVILDHFMGCARADLAGPEELDLLCELGRRHPHCYAKIGPLDHFSERCDRFAHLALLCCVWGSAHCVRVVWQRCSAVHGHDAAAAPCDRGFRRRPLYVGERLGRTRYAGLEPANLG